MRLREFLLNNGCGSAIGGVGLRTAGHVDREGEVGVNRRMHALLERLGFSQEASLAGETRFGAALMEADQ